MDYQLPKTIAEALELLQDSAAQGQVLAGGTDLLVQMQAGALRPPLIIDIKGIPETRKMEEVEGAWSVGAAVSGAELNENRAFVRAWPGVAEAFDLIGSTQIQSRATLGGNLCNASPAADSVPALIAADCHCLIVGPDGERLAAVEDIIVTPGRTSLAQGEFLVSFHFPRRDGACGDAYLRLIPRTEMDIAIAGAGVSLKFDEQGTCLKARVALGAVAPHPLLVAAAAEALEGSRLEERDFAELEAAVRLACRPISDKRGSAEYRSTVAGVLARRAALVAKERALGH